MAAAEMKAPAMMLDNAADVSMTTRIRGLKTDFPSVAAELMYAAPWATSKGANVGAASTAIGIQEWLFWD
jgi:hypothetical protein